MIRLLIDKTKFITTLSSLRNIPNILRPAREIKARTFSSEIISSQTQSTSNLTKDVIVFKYDNPRFFKMMNVFAISQLFFWGYLAHWTFFGLKDAKVTESITDRDDVSWWRKVNLGESKYKNTLATLCLVVGKLNCLVNTQLALIYYRPQATS